MRFISNSFSPSRRSTTKSKISSSISSPASTSTTHTTIATTDFDGVLITNTDSNTNHNNIVNIDNTKTTTNTGDNPTIINITNALHGAYCYLITTLWILSNHIVSSETKLGQLYYLLLLCFTLYFYLFKQSNKGLYNSLSEPSGHFVLREMIFFVPFFIDFFFMFWTIIGESPVVYLASYINPNKFNLKEQPLPDTIRMLFKYLFDFEVRSPIILNFLSLFSMFHNINIFNNGPNWFKMRKRVNFYNDIWLSFICQGYIPASAFTFVLWAVILMVGQASAPHVSGFILGKKFCRCIGVVRLVRIICFMGTIVPSSHRYDGTKTCHLVRMTEYRVMSNVPKEFRDTKTFNFWDEPINWKHLTHNHGGGGCNDLVFSGHCNIIFATLALYFELYLMYKRYFEQLQRHLRVSNNDSNDIIGNNGVSGIKHGKNGINGGYSVQSSLLGSRLRGEIRRVLFWMKLSVIYVTWLSLLSSLKMITEKHHYTVDIIVAWFVTVPIYYIIGSTNSATRDVSVVGVKDVGKPWWFVDVAYFPSYVDWINNVKNVRNYNWTARKISKIKLGVEKYGGGGGSSKKTGKNQKPFGMYLILILMIPMLGAFGILLRVT